jgi:hypothetical protein
LYQINVQVPTTGLTLGDAVYVELVTDAADIDQIQVPYGAGAPSMARTGGTASAIAHARASRMAAARAHKKMPTIRRNRGVAPTVAE